MDQFPLLNTYFKEHAYPFTKHHIDSFREFLRRHIPETVASFNPITMVKFDEDDPNKIKIKVEVFVGGDEDPLQLYVDRPTYQNENGEAVLLTPHEARMKNYSYMAHLLADVKVRYTEEGKKPIEKEFKRTWIGVIPIMLHSDICVLHDQNSSVLRELGECPYDQGGYFILDGKEKVIVSQERITTNRLFIEDTPKDPNYSHRAHIHCTGERGETALSPRTLTFYVIRTELPATDLLPDIKTDLRDYRGAIMVSMPSIPGTIPLFQLFRLLGIQSDKDIIECILGELKETTPKAYLDFLYPSIRHCADKGIFTQVQALEHIAPRTYFKSVDQVHAILVNDLFPNMNEYSGDFDEMSLYENKAKFLGQLVYDTMLTVLGVRPLSDRDGYVFKRVDISGFLLAQLFQSAYIQVKNTCRDMLDSHYHYIIKNKGQLDKLITPDNIRKFLQPTLMADIMTRSLKGRWGPKPEDPDQEIVQDLARISYIGTLSHLRRVNLPLDRSIKITSPHRLHSQQWGIMCPFESPDGASVGYLKNFALLSHVTFGTDSNTVYPCLLDLGLIELTKINMKDAMKYTAVYLNGKWLGIHPNPAQFIRGLRLYRRNALLNIFTSITWDISTNTIRVLTEAGRACRPLLIVKDNDLLLQKANNDSKWFDWIYGKRWRDIHHDKVSNPSELYYQSFYIPLDKAIPSLKTSTLEEKLNALEKTEACIEFLDIEEENSRLVAMDKSHIRSLTTHCEIHPSTIFSVVTNNIPFANHNQAPRNIFHGAQSKQAIGIYATNFSKRFDTMAYIQHYPQRPLVTTRNAQFTMNDRLPNGFNVIVAVMSYTGYNQEDGIMINKGSIDRGLFNITAYKSLSVSEEKLNETDEILIRNPLLLQEAIKDADNELYTYAGAKIQNFHPQKADYSLLDDMGVIQEESYVPSGQSATIIGLVKKTKKYIRAQEGILSETKLVEDYHDVSIRTDVHHYGKVDRVYLENKPVAVGEKYDSNPYRICRVRFRKVRKPELGDKHSSRHGQKGVIGMIIREENMPYTKDGIKPDIIINPHAFPSRMTIGHLVECVFAKLCCMDGTLGDGTVFIPFDRNVISDELEKHGFERYGNEILYNGHTGHQIPTEIFMGPTFYLRLKHMVADKMHSRGIGHSNPHDQLTKQPTAGRSSKGGLRIGEMERDSLLSHGLAQFIKESVMERSDKYQWVVCKHCGVLVEYNYKQSRSICRSCGNNELVVVETPYAMKLLIQELEAMGIQMRLSDEPFEIDEDDEEMDPEDGDTDNENEEQSGGSTTEILNNLNDTEIIKPTSVTDESIETPTEEPLESLEDDGESGESVVINEENGENRGEEGEDSESIPRLDGSDSEENADENKPAVVKEELLDISDSDLESDGSESEIKLEEPDSENVSGKEIKPPAGNETNGTKVEKTESEASKLKDGGENLIKVIHIN